MNKVVYVLVIAIIAISIGISLQPKNEMNIAYHITLADPKLYKNGTFTDNFKIQKGTYQLVLYQMETVPKIFQFH